MAINLSTLVNQTNPLQLAKVWASFGVAYSGTTLVINSAYNVSSIVRNATGTYTINFTTPFTTTTYAMVGSVTYRFYSTFGADDVAVSSQVLNTTSLQVYTTHNATLYDCEQVNIAIFGN